MSFYGHCADHRELAEAVCRTCLLVGPLGTGLPTVGDEIRSLALAEDGGTVHANGPDVPLQRFPIAPDRAVPENGWFLRELDCSGWPRGSLKNASELNDH